MNTGDHSPQDHAGNPAATWSKSDIERFLATEDLKYQRIALPFGLSTPGSDRREVCDLAFAGGLQGKTVLDIGSYLGYFCFAALERGAAAATGLEVDPIKLRQARTLAEIKGLPAVFVKDDIETMRIDRQYDVVLCLNVLHHLFDPIGVLHKLADATRHTLVLEVASLNPRDSRKLGVGFLVRRLIEKLPIIFVARGVPSFKAHVDVQKYFMSQAAILRILGSHRALFSRIDITPSSHKKRFIVVARKRRIGTLVIVSGPTSSGKSTFLKRMAGGGLPPDVAARLPASSAGWPMVGASGLLQSPESGHPALPAEDLEGAVLHYDFLRPFASGSQDFRRDQALDLIRCAEKVIVVVLRPDRERLVRQLQDSELSEKPPRGILGFMARSVGVKKNRKRHQELLNDYRKDGWLRDWYDRWESFLRQAAPGVTVVDVGEDYYRPTGRAD